MIIPDWMGQEAVSFLSTLLPTCIDILSTSFHFIQEDKDTVSKQWAGKVDKALEIGVLRGSHAQTILQYMNPAHLCLLDCWDLSDPHYKSAQQQLDNLKHVHSLFHQEKREGKVSVIKDESALALQKFPIGYFDWIFIDGDHRFHAVLLDLILCNRIVSSDGCICGHDFSGRFGIPPAVIEFCRHYPWKLDGLTIGPHSVFILKKS